MANYMLSVIYLLAQFGFVQCYRHHRRDKHHEESSELTTGQYAAICTAGAVVFALIIISIIALIIKCNKKSKTSVQPAHGKHDGVTTLSPREGVANKMPLYDDPPPMYSLRDQGPSNDVYLPPYSKSKPIEHAV
ncbi:uncharacterized protein LOC123534364 [Mercenaria mercenaria]|uniref:uncharacterized protein LOC123534364 n=1 Tax=Mercenaria mercenaria TaxID=6596 RepID=UPI00234F32E2|nr:uncharacterized protein LOC123534364 [Mercenaria mercenaria]